MYFVVSGYGLRELVNDCDIWSLVSQIEKLKEIEVWIVDPFQVYDDDNEYSEMDAYYEENIDEQLEYFNDSEYEMIEKKIDDKEFQNFIDSNVGYGGVGIGNETNQHATNVNKHSA